MKKNVNIDLLENSKYNENIDKFTDKYSVKFFYDDFIELYQGSLYFKYVFNVLSVIFAYTFFSNTFEIFGEIKYIIAFIFCIVIEYAKTKFILFASKFTLQNISKRKSYLFIVLSLLLLVSSVFSSKEGSKILHKDYNNDITIFEQSESAIRDSIVQYHNLIITQRKKDMDDHKNANLVQENDKLVLAYKQRDENAEYNKLYIHAQLNKDKVLEEFDLNYEDRKKSLKSNVNNITLLVYITSIINEVIILFLNIFIVYFEFRVQKEHSIINCNVIDTKDTKDIVIVNDINNDFNYDKKYTE